MPQLVLTDKKRLKQVLFNLIGNAIKYTFEGRIALSIDYSREENKIIGTVADTGIGIKTEDRDKLFMFLGNAKKAKDVNKGGIGLGLTISKLVIEKLGGVIGFSSVP